jgi:hypothetical protein
MTDALAEVMVSGGIAPTKEKMMSNEFGFKGYRSMQKQEPGIFAKFIELLPWRLFWLMGA